MSAAPGFPCVVLVSGEPRTGTVAHSYPDSVVVRLDGGQLVTRKPGNVHSSVDEAKAANVRALRDLHADRE